jgi:hypothetical protein
MPINIPEVVEETLAVTPFIDIHTHLFAPAFGDLGLWGIDELLTYHYLEAELFRFSSISPDRYFALNKQQKADLIWRTLFVENGPLSEATRGIVAVLYALGLDTASTTLKPQRQFFREQDPAAYIPRVFGLAGIVSAVMTNDPLDPAEAAYWNGDLDRDPMFHAALRLDRIVNERDSRGQTVAEARGFIETWAARMKPVYMAISLPDTFQFPVDDARTRLLAEAVIPVCQDRNIPLALMIGVRRNVNPALGLAGDASGRADLRCLETLSAKYPRQRFLISVLSRENQHELCVYARKFSNLMPFGCWWFLNNPSIVEEITRERIEMLGTSFIPQHSDARVLEQLIYKWRNTRRTLAPILAKSYELLVEDGREVTAEVVRRDVTRLFRTNFEEWTGLRN